MELVMVRGDTKRIKFKILDKNGTEIILSNTDKLFFTVKNNEYCEDVLIQKTLENGIIYSDGYYHITIESIDTDSLDYRTYLYDIELKSGTIVKTLIIGTLRITKECTFASNEV